MTATSWSTSADIPLNAWTPMVADMRALLDVAANGGAVVTGPDGTGPAVLDDDTIGFTVQAAAPAPPMTVQFTRAAGASSVVTNAATTGGLVVAALSRAERYWGPLLTWSTEADTKAHAVARELADGLFGAGDRAVVGIGEPESQQGTVAELVTRATTRVFTATADSSRLDYLSAIITELTSERVGVVTAGAMLAPHTAPAKLVAQVRAELAAELAAEPAEEAEPVPAKRRRAPAKPKTS